MCIRDREMSAAPNGDVLVKCGAGEVFDDIVARTLKAGIGGLENLSAIPGTVGGAVVQNIGAYGVELAERLSSVTVYDLSLIHISEPTRRTPISYAVFCLKKKKLEKKTKTTKKKNIRKELNQRRCNATWKG